MMFIIALHCFSHIILYLISICITVLMDDLQYTNIGVKHRGQSRCQVLHPCWGVTGDFRSSQYLETVQMGLAKGSFICIDVITDVVQCTEEIRVQYRGFSTAVK